MPTGRYSFRTILLSRLLLLSVPVLLVGVYITYSKARAAFLQTAQQNLTESAIRKSESINQSIEALQSNLITASDTLVIKADWQEDQQRFLERLAEKLPTQIHCLQLKDIATDEIRASTCGNEAIAKVSTSQWQQKQEQVLSDRTEIYTDFYLGSDRTRNSQLDLLLVAPVYDFQDRLRYALYVKTSVLQQERVEQGSLEGYPVVINEQGVILAHPISQRVGRHISEMPDATRLENLLQSAIAGQKDYIHLFFFEKRDRELVAGYSAIPSPITNEKNQKWVILAFTPLSSALSALKEIKTVLVILTVALIGASVLATVYISRELARPLERIRDYAINEHNLRSKARVPQNFNIREFEELSVALNETLDRLQAAWEEAENANQLKIEFLRTTSHELRNPLNGIIGCISVVMEDLCDGAEEEKEFLQKAYKAADHLKGIIEDILDMAKIEAGKLSLNPESVNLNKVIQEVVELQAVGAKNKGLELKVSQAREDIIVTADRGKLKQVLINAISNAVKFTQVGSIVVNTTIEKVEKIPKFQTENNGDNNSKIVPEISAQEKVVIRVKDTGIGIDPERQSKLFRPFVLVDGSTTRQFGGTGLGLAISRKLMELMGGDIALYSEGLGKGTTVTIVLLLAPPADEENNNGKRTTGPTTMDYSNSIFNYSSDKDI